MKRLVEDILSWTLAGVLGTVVFVCLLVVSFYVHLMLSSYLPR
jgi:hypothetical protein